MIRALVLSSLIAAAALPVAAQNAETLADLRAELMRLAQDLQSLRGELVAGGQSAMQAAGGTGALDRMNAMEAEIVRLTARTEELQNRVDRVVADGTNRIGDLEFRICELEDGCDVSNMPITGMLGGAAGGGGAAVAPAAPSVPEAPASNGGTPELAISEQADFDRAKAALDGGEYQAAADGFAAFANAYPGSPLTGNAHFLRGEAMAGLGDTSGAARAYLDAFSGAPDGPMAPAALFRLGAALGLLGQVQEACVTLGEVPRRFPNAPEAAEATSTMQTLGCQ
ncbi:MAG: tol-pal system protein YbgF [Rhodobacteraceae bacterium]|uniref:tol-pal system protein YbgF n=1 Tax=Albidovulum sp. TaxID=1872424 RepID=UPI001DA8ABC4|nr:tol-pal system protein YbgF [Paracoccaceae bacterium]HPE26115.1 tol-pal system protein YbgF [Albidovulum sp.]MCB2123066.1 tol-pal system protein YbgF [Paracoccaceae bacterium]MCB2131728.1 tol-pal system protein YbgF [Paracoccaceae bacterium]MCB2143430.1 tol-pal system protein YbgF [Paracoccaceae bacterium]